MGSFEDLYLSYVPMVYGYFLRRVGGDVPTAEDLTQETFVSAARTWSPVVVSPSAWLVSIARRRLVDYIRQSTREQRSALWRLSSSDGSVAAGEASTSEDLVTVAMARLKPEYRLVLVLYHVDGLRIDEVSKLMARSPHAIESLLVRARSALRAAFLEVVDD